MFSAKILIFLITSTFFLQCTSRKQAHHRGTPEVDYPLYYAIPKTSFRCSDQLYNPGFYADTEARCQVFHYCYEHRQESFLCPMGTIFNQPILACDYWYSSNCTLAPSYYNVNAVQRNKYIFDEADDPLDSQSETLFDKMAHLYEIYDKTTESDVLENDSGTSENDSLSIDGIESSSAPFAEKNNKAEDYNKYSYDKQFDKIDETQPEVVTYDDISLNAVNVHKGSGNEQPFETVNVKEDIYQMYPTDMNFDQGYSGFAEISKEGNFNYDLNDGFDSESDFQTPDFEFQKRRSDVHGNYVRRPSSRKPIIIIPEEPEIVQLPVPKRKRKRIGIDSTVSTNADVESSHKTTIDHTNNQENVSVPNEGLEDTTSGDFPLDEPNSNLNHTFSDPKLLFESQEEIKDEKGLQLYQMDSSSLIYDYTNKEETRNAYVTSNIDEEEISSNALTESNYGDELEKITERDEGSVVFPGASSDTTVLEGSSFDSDSFLGSGSEGNIIQAHSRDGPSFPEDQGIFSDSEDTEITDLETPYVLPMNLWNTFEGSGISFKKTANIPNLPEEVNEPIQFVLKDDSEDNIEYDREEDFSSETFEQFPSSESSENNEGAELVPEGSGGFSDFNYLPLELQESSDNSQDGSDETVLEIQQIDGDYYFVSSDSEYHSNYDRDDLSGFYQENVDYDDVSGKFEDNPEKVDSVGSQYVPERSNLKMDDIEVDALDYRDSEHLENTYKKLSDEFETVTSSDIPEEEHIVDGSDTAKQLVAEDLKILETMSQTPVPMLKNLFEVSEKLRSDAIKGEISRIEIISSEQDIDQIHEDSTSMEEVYKFDNFASDTSSYIEENSLDMESSDIHSEILDAEQKIAEDYSNTNSSDQNEAEVVLPEQNSEVFVSGKETDRFSPLFAESEEILDGIGNKQKFSLKDPPIKSKIAAVRPVLAKDLKKVARGKRLSEKFLTFNPPNKGNPLTAPSKETFREAMFASIPSEFLKMKHSTLRPYFYNYGLKNSGFNPRTGDLYKSSKLSKLTAVGKRLLAAKRAKFNIMKKYLDSYRTAP